MGEEIKQREKQGEEKNNSKRSEKWCLGQFGLRKRVEWKKQPIMVVFGRKRKRRNTKDKHSGWG